MRTLHKYISGGFIVAFFMALLVLSFVMSVGLLYKATTLLSRGASASVILQYICVGLPFTLSYSIPISLLVSSLLVFGRLSADGEITAMRTCGVSLLTIMRMPLLFSLFLSVFCLFLNNDVSPESSYSRKSVRRNLGVAEIAAMIEPGRVIEDDSFPGCSFYVRERIDDVLYGVRIIETLNNGGVREISAEKAVISLEDENQVLCLDMSDVSVNTFPLRPGITSGRVDFLPYRFQTAAARAKEDSAVKHKRRIKDKPTWVLRKEVVAAKTHPPRTEKGIRDISRSKVEINSRLALALACFCFVFIGIPLGIKQRRRESSVGIGLSLAVAGAFYLFAILGESLSQKPGLGAEYVVLIPVALCLLLGMFLVVRNN